QSADIADWDRIKDKDNPDALQEYLLRHAQGRFTELARMKLERMGIAPLEQNPLPPAIPIAPLLAPAPLSLVEPPLREIAQAPTPPDVTPDDLFATTRSVRPDRAEPKSSVAPMLIVCTVLLVSMGGGLYYLMNGSAGSAKSAAAVPLAETPASLPSELPRPPEQGSENDTPSVATVPEAGPSQTNGVVVEPYTGPEPVVVRGTNVRLREAPFADADTQVLGVAMDGETLRIAGMIRQPDWVWYKVVMLDGRAAFIRSDLTSVSMPGAGDSVTDLNLRIVSVGDVYWGNNTLSEGELASRVAVLARQVPQPLVVLTVAPETAYQQVAVVRSIVQKSGIVAIRFKSSGLTLSTPLLPPPNASPQVRPPPITIRIESDGATLWNGQTVTYDQLGANLSREGARYAKPEIRIEPHKRAAFATVDNVHLLSKQAGLESMVEELPFIFPDFVFDNPPPTVLFPSGDLWGNWKNPCEKMTFDQLAGC
ncbi:MAG: biopolymer transporter ExbD, partial [Hyphomonadaceae bacterium]